MFIEPVNAYEMKKLQRLEAQKIYRSIFGSKIPPILKERFVAASDATLNQTISASSLNAYYRVIQQIDDLEALELACRYGRRLPFLQLKFQLMVYLAETLPQNQHFFFNRQKSYLKAVSAMLFGSLYSLFKLLKGVLLLAKVKP